jgi:hypothetical protein
MRHAAAVRVVVSTLVAAGCSDGRKGTELGEDPVTTALTYLSRQIKVANPGERIAVYGVVYCGFPGECRAPTDPRPWPPGALDGALRELDARAVHGNLRTARARSGVDLVVAFGPIHSVGPTRVETVVRYERRDGARIAHVAMMRRGAEWSVEAETTISTATYVYTVPHLDTLERR